MSESNYPVVQLKEKIWEYIWWAETFTPRETHDVKHAVVKLHATIFIEGVTLSIQYATGGIPVGVDLVTANVHWPILEKYPLNKPVMFTFPNSFRIVAGIEYAVVIRTIPAWPLRSCWFTYEAPPGHYPRGKLLKSTNSGITWDATDRGDMLFAEWGNPPLKPVPSVPPLDKFALIDLTYNHWDIGLTICLATDVPCHLTCYYTDKAPLKHQVSRTVRGLSVPWQTYFCFVAWKEVEQSEYGATLYHTFEFPTWLEGQTFWFTFRGEIDLEDSPSVGPIFKHTHPGGTSRIITLRPNAPGDLTQIGAQVPASGEHWDKVDDISPDEMANYVWHEHWGVSNEIDLYNLPNLIPGQVSKIASVSITTRVRKNNPNLLYSYSNIKTGGSIYSSPVNWLSESFRDFIYPWTLNPQTNERWTVDEINALQAGVMLRANPGGGQDTHGICTQVFIQVTRGVEGCPD